MSNQVMLATDSTNQVRKVLASSQGKLQVDCATTLSEASSSVLIYGNDGSENKVIKTDNSGIVSVNVASQPALVPSTDGIKIYGEDSGASARVVLTGTDGSVIVNAERKTILDGILWNAQSLAGESTGNATASVDMENYKHIHIYGTTNNGVDSVKMQISHDNATWFNSPEHLCFADEETFFALKVDSVAPRYVRFIKNNSLVGAETVTLRYTLMK